MTHKRPSRADGHTAETLYAKIDALWKQNTRLSAVTDGQKLTVSADHGLVSITISANAHLLNLLAEANAAQIAEATNELAALGFDPDAAAEPE